MAYYNKQNTGPSLEDKALDRFAEMMIEKIKSIRDDWKKPWFTESSMVWPKNLSGREYNGMNAFMLMLHSEANGYKIPVFMTFDRVVGLNYNKDKAGNKSEAKDKNGEPLPKVTVNKGEKSFPVFITTFTVVNKETKEKISYDDYRKLSNEEQAQYNVYPKQNIYNVFNVDQTNLKESRPELYQELESKNTIQQPEREEGEAFSFPAVDKLIKDNLWICPIKTQHQDNAYYSISKNEIYVPEKEQFKDGESFYGTTFHEMAHSTGAEAHLNRLKPSTFGSAEYAREELVAELTAALTCQRYGITKNIKDDSAAYLKSWLNNLKESPDFIKSTLIDVKKATAIITQKIDTLQLSIENEMANQEKQPSKQFVPEVTNLREKPDEYHDVIDKIHSFMTVYYWGAMQDNGFRLNGFRLNGFSEFEGKPAVKLTNTNLNASSFYIVTHEQDAEEKDHYYLRLMDDNKEVLKTKELPWERNEVYSLLYRAAEEQQDYEFEKKYGTQNEQKPNETFKTKTFDIPIWALPYIFNGDSEGITEKEKEIVDKFLKENFPEGFAASQIDGTEKELNLQPAFGTRNENALTRRGESAYEAVDTISVEFLELKNREKRDISTDERNFVQETIGGWRQNAVFEGTYDQYAKYLESSNGNLEDDKFSETKQQTVAYAIEHITGQGNHSGFGWLRDSFNELCNLNTVNDEQITPEQIRYHRSSIAHLISKECSDKLDAEQLKSLEDILDDLSDQYEREENVGYRR